MSAIGEWFGYYSAIFNYMEKTYGREELERYLDYIAKVPNCDISAQYRAGGLDAIRARYEKNFRLDGDENTVRSVCDGESLQMQVRCPAYFNAPPSAHPARQITERFCDCCIRLNTGILREAGYALTVQKTGTGTCEWCIRKEEDG